MEFVPLHVTSHTYFNKKKALYVFWKQFCFGIKKNLKIPSVTYHLCCSRWLRFVVLSNWSLARSIMRVLPSKPPLLACSESGWIKRKAGEPTDRQSDRPIVKRGGWPYWPWTYYILISKDAIISNSSRLDVAQMLQSSNKLFVAFAERPYRYDILFSFWFLLTKQYFQVQLICLLNGVLYVWSALYQCTHAKLKGKRSFDVEFLRVRR